MLFRSNLSVCPLSLSGLYFYAVPSPPAANDGGGRRVAEEQGTHGTGGEDVTPDADGELCATGVGVMAGVAEADAGPPDTAAQEVDAQEVDGQGIDGQGID